MNTFTSKQMRDLAPVALFVYNRPWHTEQTLRALSRNKLAEKTNLFIFSDSSKDDRDADAVKKVREIIRQEFPFAEKTIIENQLNKGLATSILDGVSKLTCEFGKAIILEDDHVTSAGFLEYMNKALEVYKEEKKVMHVSAYIAPVRKKLPETFFFASGTCWGWATWRDRWDKLIRDYDWLKSELQKQNAEHYYNFDGATNYTAQIDDNLKGKIRTWAALWHGTIILNNGLALHPGKSLVKNIGLDGSGVHKHISKTFLHKKLAENIEVVKLPAEENLQARKIVTDFYRAANKTGITTRTKAFIKTKLGL